MKKIFYEVQHSLIMQIPAGIFITAFCNAIITEGNDSHYLINKQVNQVIHGLYAVLSGVMHSSHQMKCNSITGIVF